MYVSKNVKLLAWLLRKLSQYSIFRQSIAKHALNMENTESHQHLSGSVLLFLLSEISKPYCGVVNTCVAFNESCNIEWVW